MSRKRKAFSLAESIHDELICPITYEMPAEPVYAEDGRLYERSAIEQWFAADNRSSPMTKLPMGTRLVDAVQVRNVIERIVESGELPEERAREWRANREAKRAEEHARLLTGLSAQRRALKVDDALRRGSSMQYPGGRKTLKPEMRSRWPSKSSITRAITPSVSTSCFLNCFMQSRKELYTDESR